jgi:hypothetical protein
MVHDFKFLLQVAVNHALLRYYTASSGNFLATFRDDLWGPIFKNPKKMYPLFGFLTFEDRTNRSSRHVGKELPVYAA